VVAVGLVGEAHRLEQLDDVVGRRRSGVEYGR
jgi:hypothetical protein